MCNNYRTKAVKCTLIQDKCVKSSIILTTAFLHADALVIFAILNFMTCTDHCPRLFTDNTMHNQPFAFTFVSRFFFLAITLFILANHANAQVTFTSPASPPVSVKLVFKGDTIGTETAVVSVSAQQKVVFNVTGLQGNLACRDGGIEIKLRQGTSAIIPLNAANRYTFVMNNQIAFFTIWCNGSKKGSGFILNKPVPDSPTNAEKTSNTKEETQISSAFTLRDAIKLAELYRNRPSGWESSMQLVFSKYGIKDCKGYPYLEPYCSILEPKLGPVVYAGEGDSKLAQPGVISSASGIFNPTFVIDALAKFAANQFKQEITIAFLQRFRDTLLSDQYKPLRYLLPRTYYTFLTADVFNYAQFYQSLHENAQTDLFNLPENLAILIRSQPNAVNPEVYPVLLAGLDLYKSLEIRQPAALAIESLAFRDYVVDSTVYGKTVRTLGLFSKHLRNWEGESATGWAQEQYLQQLAYDEHAFNFWMTLMLKQEQPALTKIKFGNGTLYDLLNQPNGGRFRVDLSNLVSRMAALQYLAQSNTYNKFPIDSSKQLQILTQYATGVFDLVEAGLQMAKGLDGKNIAQYERVGQILKTAREVVQFAHSLRFGDALSVTLEILRTLYLDPFFVKKQISALSQEINDLEKVIPEVQFDELFATYQGEKKAVAFLTSGLEQFRKKIKGIGNTFEEEKVLAQINALESEVAQLLLKSSLIRIVDKYGNLLVTCANAKSSDEMLRILEKTAAPVQSYRRKRGNPHFSASINMYAGLGFGLETRLDSLGKKEGDPGPMAAFTAPLGISLDWGIGKTHSLGVFFPLIDVGAVTAFRLQDNVSSLPELAWKNVFAPGMYVVWGIGRTPLSLGVGGQYGPALRKVTKDNLSYSAANYRVGMSLTVDIPLFFMHNGMRKR